MKNTFKCQCTLLFILFFLVFGLYGCSDVVSSMWVGSNGQRSARLDDIDPQSRLLLEGALNNRDGIVSGDSFSKLPEIPKVDAPEVSRFFDFYSSGPGRTLIEEGMGRREFYAPQLSKIMLEYGLPRELVNLPFLESRYLTKARSPSGAVGMWQFMRDTARSYGLTVSFFSDERTDVERASRAAAVHLRDLYDTFEDWNLALAAYNGGIGRVQDAVKNAGTRDFFELARGGYLPKETREYVPKFLAITKVVEGFNANGLALNGPIVGKSS